MLERNCIYAALDTLGNLHDLDENDNSAMKQVVRVVKQLAVNTNAAIDLLCHTGKGDIADPEKHAGDPNALRGASAIVAELRYVCTLAAMGKSSGDFMDVEQNERQNHIRLDDAKVNGRAKEPTFWLYRVSVDLGLPDGADRADRK